MSWRCRISVECKKHKKKKLSSKPSKYSKSSIASVIAQLSPCTGEVPGGHKSRRGFHGLIQAGQQFVCNMILKNLARLVKMQEEFWMELCGSPDAEPASEKPTPEEPNPEEPIPEEPTPEEPTPEEPIPEEPVTENPSTESQPEPSPGEPIEESTTEAHPPEPGPGDTCPPCECSTEKCFTKYRKCRSACQFDGPCMIECKKRYHKCVDVEL
ncbi:uncharacterized protein LOC142977181 isoform X2 [Anticarsia gemmatalis]|uniref:uncharacterized protein LOC142977181 isoform X2 n=1 Tax=Anticarsia gemmatalis TaxID=129554 RepID=UPI003F76A925